MARDAGAARIYFVSCSPEVTNPHIYGIDLADPAELVAHGKTPREIAQHISADEVVFQSIKDLEDACMEAAEGESKITGFEVGVFCGKYVTGVPEGYFEHLSRLRGRKGTTTTILAEDRETGAGAVLVTNSGPVNVVSDQQRVVEDYSAVRNGAKSPDYQEDIRYVMIVDDLLLCYLILTTSLIVFIISQAKACDILGILLYRLYIYDYLD